MAAQSSSSNLTTASILIVLLSVVGVGPSLLNLSAKPLAQAAASRSINAESASVSAAGQPSAAALLDSFFAIGREQTPNGKPWSQSQQASGATIHQWPKGDVRNGYMIAFLIATLPAPTSAPLRYDFDSFLDALQLAFGSAGYVLDSFDLPTLKSWRTPGAGGGASEAMEVPRTASGSATGGSEGGPGVMLFHSAADRHLLMLFIASETPTRGVNKAELRDALDQISWLAGWKSNGLERPAYLRELTKNFNAENQVRIVGPVFSGSAISLRATLDEWFGSLAQPQPKITIISGTATSVGGELKDSHVHFSSVRIPDSAILPLVVYDLQHGLANLEPKVDDRALRDSADHSAGAPQITILSDNTLYGATGASVPGVRRMAFPLHISDLRTAFNRAEPESTPMTSPTSKREIPVETENELDVDTVPHFSVRSAAYNELVLEAMLGTISREGIRYVGVVATDVEDLIFLVHRIREYCRSAVVFTTSSNLRFVRSDANHELDGVVVFSTYPLFPLNQSWTYPFRMQEVQFPSEDAEGIFNAALAIQGERRSMIEYGEPFAARSALDGPPLWVGVVGNHGIWPLGFHRLPMQTLTDVLPADAAGGDDPAPHLQFRDTYPAGAEAAFLILSVLCVVPCYLLVRLKFTATARRPERGWAEMVMGDAVLDELSRERWMRISAFIGGWLMAYAVAVVFLLLPLRAAFGIVDGSRSFSDLIATSSIGSTLMLACGSAAVVTMMLLIALGIALAQIRRPASVFNATVNAPTGAILSLLGTAVGFLLVAGFLRSVWLQPAPFAMLRFIRAANLTDSVSPLLPLAFLGFANLCLIGCDIWRLSLLEDCRMELPFLGFEDGGASFLGTAANERRVVGLLECPPWALPGAAFFLGFSLLALAAFGLTNGWPPIHSIDGAAFDWLFFLSAVFIYTYFSILLLRFVLVWGALHKLLRRLYWHPTRSCYEELRVKSLPERPEDQRIRLIEPPASLTAMEFCLQCARTILRMGEDQVEAHPTTLGFSLASGRHQLDADVRRVERHLSEILEAQQKEGWRAAIIKRVDAQEAMASVSERVVAIAEPAWRLQAGDRPPALDAIDTALLEQSQLFIAGRVVDFLRHVFIQLRGLSSFAMVGVLAMMLAMSAYPFPSHNLLLWLSWIVMLSAITVSFSVFVSINRDRVISMLSGTQPGRFNWDSTIVARMLLYGVLPILALLGAQLPGGVSSVVSWFGGLVGAGHP